MYNLQWLNHMLLIINILIYIVYIFYTLYIYIWYLYLHLILQYTQQQVQDTVDITEVHPKKMINYFILPSDLLYYWPLFLSLSLSLSLSLQLSFRIFSTGFPLIGSLFLGNKDELLANNRAVRAPKNSTCVLRICFSILKLRIEGFVFADYGF